MPVWLIWLIAALGLAGAEALTGDLFLLMLSGGALAAVGSNLIFDDYVGRRHRFHGGLGAVAGGGAPALRRRFTEGTGLPDRRKRWKARVRWCSTAWDATRVK